MLFCLHLKTGRYLVPTGQTPHLFTRPSILVHPRKGLHKPPVIIGGGGRYCPDVRNVYFDLINIYKYNYTLRLTICQLYAKLLYMSKNRIFKISDGTETKEVEAMSYKKAVRSFQGSSKAKMITIEWTTKKGEEFFKEQLIPLGRKKKLR